MSAEPFAYGGLTAAIGALWAKIWAQSREHKLAIANAIAAEQAACGARLTAIEGRIAKIEGERDAELARLRGERDDWLLRWERECARRVVDFNTHPPHGGAPGRPPLPSIAEDDEVSMRRHTITEMALREYVESTRPKPRQTPTALAIPRPPSPPRK